MIYPHKLYFSRAIYFVVMRAVYAVHRRLRLRITALTIVAASLALNLPVALLFTLHALKIPMCAVLSYRTLNWNTCIPRAVKSCRAVACTYF